LASASLGEGVLAVLYDIHGNLPALEEVLKDADAAGARSGFLAMRSPTARAPERAAFPRGSWERRCPCCVATSVTSLSTSKHLQEAESHTSGHFPSRPAWIEL
jgi:hypothetical protein